MCCICSFANLSASIFAPFWANFLTLRHLSLMYPYCLQFVGRTHRRFRPGPHLLALPASFHSGEMQMAWPTSSDTCWGVHYTALMEGGHGVTKQTVKVQWHHSRHVIGARWLSFWSAGQRAAIFTTHHWISLSVFYWRRNPVCLHCVKDCLRSRRLVFWEPFQACNTENQAHVSRSACSQRFWRGKFEMKIFESLEAEGVASQCEGLHPLRCPSARPHTLSRWLPGGDLP